MQRLISARIQAIVRQELKDQKLVEVEVTEAVVARLTNWAKLLGFVAGIPLALLLFVLGGLGIKKYADLWALVDAAKNKITPAVESARTQTDQLKQRSDDVRKQLADLEPQLADIKATSEKLTGYEKAFDEKFAGLQKGLDQRLGQLQNNVNDIAKAVAHPSSERWPVKTGRDSDRRLVGRSVISKTVEELCNLPRPKELADPTAYPPEYQNKRVCPVECTIYVVDATIIRLKRESDGDYHMILQGASGQTMIAAIPTATKKFLGDSPWLKEIAAARNEVDRRLNPLSQGTNMPVRVTGVGFFDRAHRATGAAPNVIELHPVLSVKFLE